MKTIRHQDVGIEVVVAKLLTGYVTVSKKVTDADSFIKVHQTYDAGFVAHVLAWQSNKGLDSDGIIGPKTWAAIAAKTPTCSTSKNRISGPTLALQFLLDTNISCDAIFGSRTKDAVAVYQTSKGLKADGVCGAKTWAAILATSAATTPATGTAPAVTPTAGTFKQPPDFKQGDKRWGSKMYSNHGDKKQTMANSACGPTSMADIVAALKDASVTPYDLALLAMKWGDRTYSNGTSWSFFKHIMSHYNFSKMVQSKSIDALKACLDAGGYVVCSMGPGYWTSGGHFICAWAYDATYVYCNDPASSKRKKQKITEFMKERKQFFCFYPDAITEDNAGGGAVSSAPGYGGEKIVDISKWQPTVNYDALLEDTALVILRAGYRGTLGSVKIDECFKKHADALRARGVRFGVYFYSIADTEAKAIEEARKFVDYAQEYNPLFYAIDAEKPSITTAAIGMFADELRRLGIQRIGAYIANEKYASPYNFDAVRDKYDFVWIPKYSSTKPKWKCDLWQYSSTERVAGINGNVDMNIITGQGKTLAWFLGDE